MEQKSAGALDRLWKQRIQAVEEHDQGRSVQEIANAIGLSRPAIYYALDLAREAREAGVDLDDALKPKRRGRSKGDGRLLSPRREEELRTLLLSRRPSELGISGGTWTRATVRQLIERRFLLRRRGEATTLLTISDRAIGDYLSRWGLTGSITRGLDSKVDLSGDETFTSAARLGELCFVWELLAWSLASTAQLQHLLLLAATEAWDAQSLFHTLAREGAFARRRRHLMAYINLQLLADRVGASDGVSPSVIRVVRTLLNSSAGRTRERDRLVGSGTAPGLEHWSIRLVSAKIVDVLAQSPRPGRQSLPMPRAYPDTFDLLLCLNWTTGQWHIGRVGTLRKSGRKLGDDPESDLAAAMRRAMGPPPKGSAVRWLVHLPQSSAGEEISKRLAAALLYPSVRVRYDAPPNFPWQAGPIVERHLVRRRAATSADPGFAAGDLEQAPRGQSK